MGGKPSIINPADYHLYSRAPYRDSNLFLGALYYIVDQAHHFSDTEAGSQKMTKLIDEETLKVFNNSALYNCTLMKLPDNTDYYTPLEVVCMLFKNLLRNLAARAESDPRDKSIAQRFTAALTSSFLGQLVSIVSQYNIDSKPNVHCVIFTEVRGMLLQRRPHSDILNIVRHHLELHPSNIQTDKISTIHLFK